MVKSVFAAAVVGCGMQLMLTAPTVAAIYYVSPSGNNANPGTLAEPWKTIQRAVNAATPGTTILVRAGVYRERVTINRSGSQAGGFITLSNFSGEKPVLDGTGLAPDPGNGDMGALYLFNRSFVRIQGFEIRNYRTASGDNTPAGIWVVGQGTNIELIGNNVHHIATTANGGNAHGIAVYGTGAQAALRNVVIRANTVHHNILGFSEAVVLNGNVDRFEVSGNRVYANDNIGIDAIGFEGVSANPALDQARNGVISGNTVYDNSAEANPAYGGDLGAGGIYIDGGRNIVVERNVSYRNDIGIEVASEHAGKGTSNITVRNNFIYRNVIGGFFTGGFNVNRGFADRIVFVNNTLFENDRLQWGLGEILLQHDVRNSQFRNNIVRANSQGRLIFNPFTVNTANTLNYNLYWAPPGAPLRWQWRKTVHATLAAWRTATGGDGQALVADPRLASTTTPDLHVQATSPAIDRGQTLAVSGTQDIDGAARITGARIDIGADER